MSWAEVKKINNDLSTPLDVTLGKKTDLAGTATGASLFSFIKSIWDSVNTSTTRGIVKRVQRGLHAGSADYNNINITIATVDPSKCLVLLYGARGVGSGVTVWPTLYGLYSTTLSLGASRESVSSPGLAAISFSWQVIEFY